MHIWHLLYLLLTCLFAVIHVAHIFFAVSTDHEEVPPYVLMVARWNMHILRVSSDPSMSVTGVNDKIFGGPKVPWSWHLHCVGLTWRRLATTISHLEEFSVF